MTKRHRCPYCRKLVTDKPIIGTMHICLEPEERDRIDRHKLALLKHQQKHQSLVELGGGGLQNLGKTAPIG